MPACLGATQGPKRRPHLPFSLLSHAHQGATVEGMLSKLSLGKGGGGSGGSAAGAGAGASAATEGEEGAEEGGEVSCV